MDSEEVSKGHITLAGLQRRRSSLFNPRDPLQPSFTWKVEDNQKCSVVQTDGTETVLAHKKQSIHSVKNFNLELRGLQDVESLIGTAIIILNPQSCLIVDLIDNAVAHACVSVKNLEIKSFGDEVRKGIFTDEQGQIFTNTFQGFNANYYESSFESSWLCAFCNVSKLKKRLVIITRLKEPTNFGHSSEQVRFLIFILCPNKDKGTKSNLETARTFGTLFSDSHLRQTLLYIHNEKVFRNTIIEWARKLADIPVEGKPSISLTKSDKWPSIGSGIKNDILRRIPYYVSDYKDGVKDLRAIQKTVSTAAFLYFACLLPTIAFATLNHETTLGVIDVRKGILAQAVGQLFFSFFGGQHLNILLTTAPLCLFVKIIYGFAEYFDIVNQFAAFYCCVGLWCCLFLFISAIFNLSMIMKWYTRSTQEIFALFISVAYVVDALKDVSQDFQKNYYSPSCVKHLNSSVEIFPQNHTNPINLSTSYYLTNGHSVINDEACNRDLSLLFILLMLGTAWFGLSLYNFKNTPFLQYSKRELLSDYSLPFTVLLFSFIGSFIFQDIQRETFVYNDSKPLLQLAQIQNLPFSVILWSAFLGFSLSILIFMDQSIGAAIVNNPSNQLIKGPAYHWDLVVVTFINIFCSLFTLPWLHVALPHAPLHVKNLADIEEKIENGVVCQKVIRVRETRLSGIISHILLGLSLLLLPYPLSFIPMSVFDGLYLYMGITALGGNQMFERTLLFFTEQTAYPPNHFMRRVPQRKIHQFTFIQILQLLLLCFLGFFPFPFARVVFPLVLVLLLFVRHQVLPIFIERKYLEVLD